MKKKKMRSKSFSTSWPLKVYSGSSQLMPLSWTTVDTDLQRSFLMKPTNIIVNVRMIYGKGKRRLTRKYRLSGTLEEVKKQLQEIK